MIANKRFAALALVLTGAFSYANASVIQTYTLSNSAAFGTGPFGNVVLTQNTISGTAKTDVTVDVTLASNYVYNLAGSAGTKNNFTFNLTTNPNAVVTYDTNRFSLAGPSTFNNNPYGIFNYSFDVIGSGNNGMNTSSPHLVFTVDGGATDTNGIQISDFLNSTANSAGQPGGYGFSADLFKFQNCTTDSCTGNVASSQGANTRGTLATADSTAVPEPSTLALLGLGILGFAFARRRA